MPKISIKYTSTRDRSVSVDSASAVIDGIPSSGGLYVPENVPTLRWQDLLELDYPKIVDKVLRAFFDFDVAGIASKSFKNFDDEPAPIVKLDDNLFVLELWHGATYACTDMAMSVFPRLLVGAKADKRVEERTLVLVAAGGDVCAAALDGFGGVDGVSVCAFYPTDGVSAVQRLAMCTQHGDNVRAAGVVGNSDDVRNAVKTVFADPGLKQALAENNISLTSGSFINIGSLVPQIAYYFSTYCDLIQSGEINHGDKIDYIVPTGNSDNVLAGYYAAKMGLPVNRIVCASNTNCALTDFIATGTYDVNRELYKTDSPSMDVLVANNLERLIFEASGRNAELTAERMASLEANGMYSLTQSEMDDIRAVIAADYVTDEDIEDAIVDMFDEYGYLIGPHTAAVYAVARRREAVRPTVVVATANPFKFAPTVLRALGERASDDVTEEMFDTLEELSAMDAPERLKRALTNDLRFGDSISTDEVAEYITLHYARPRDDE